MREKIDDRSASTEFTILETLIVPITNPIGIAKTTEKNTIMHNKGILTVEESVMFSAFSSDFLTGSKVFLRKKTQSLLQ